MPKWKICTCQWLNSDKPVFQRKCARIAFYECICERVCVCLCLCVCAYVETTTILKLLSLREKSVLSATKIYGFRYLSVNCWIYTHFFCYCSLIPRYLSLNFESVREWREWKGIESDIFFIKPTASHWRTIFISFSFLFFSFFSFCPATCCRCCCCCAIFVRQLRYLQWHIPSRHTDWYRHINIYKKIKELVARECPVCVCVLCSLYLHCR